MWYSPVDPPDFNARFPKVATDRSIKLAVEKAKAWVLKQRRQAPKEKE